MLYAEKLGMGCNPKGSRSYSDMGGPLKKPKVVALIVNLVMGLPGLDYTPSNVLHHLELFAGDCAVSRAEHMDCRGW